MTFRIGQKVCCVDVEGNHHLALHAVYTVSGIFNAFPSGKSGIFIAEVHEAHDKKPFYASRFRPIVERKTDISIFRAMLNPSKRSVDA